jgi:copper chaperone NosL
MSRRRDGRRSKAKLLAMATLLLAACQSASLQPVELSAEDMCALCRMAISERQYAAELITKEGDVFKFDDLGCLANYVADKQKRAQVAIFYMMDYEARRWLKAEEAYFVRAEKFPTPMSGHMIAFGDRAKAEAAATANQGQLISFTEVLASGH